MQIMITNGGPHPADKWADATTETILGLIQISDDADTADAAYARQVKREMRPVLFNLFNTHHGDLQKFERAECKKDGKRAGNRRFDPSTHASKAAADLHAVLAATPFASHFARPEVKEVLERIIGQHFVNSMNIERCYHRDRQAKGS